MPTGAGNMLADAVSPYLLQHRDNPVHWREWSRETLAEAARLDRPVLLSVGYAACHWCHVMAHESFEDPAVAEVMNRLFVNVKVDREERPDVDHVYMTALHALGEQGGWPMTMFLTPLGEPFWGGTYFPKEPRYGRPGFVQVLEAIARAWKENRPQLLLSANVASERLSGYLETTAAPFPLDAGAVESAAARVAGMIDMERGGLKGAPKFPSAPLLELVARGAPRERGAPLPMEFLATLRSLCRGGIYDHLGGGLARYSVDERWLVPHFEKMLYDNAQFLRHLAWGWRATGERLFRDRIEETVGWLEREMLTDGGGFAASLDADSLDGHGHSEEGAFYVWHEAEIDAVLGPASGPFKAAYDVEPEGNWEGKTILNQLGAPETGASEFAAERASLLARRAARPRPGRDDKVLADWNGLMIRALAEVFQATGDRRALTLAEAAFAFVLEEMAGDGRLHHAWREGRRSGLALSSDYGALIGAAAALFAATLEPAYLRHGARLADALDRWHGDGDGGHFMTASDTGDIMLRPRGDHDEAVPGGTALVVEGLALLAQLGGDLKAREQAERAAELALGRAGASVSPGLLAGVDRLLRGSELVLVGESSDLQLGGMISAANRAVDLSRVDLVVAADQTLPDAVPTAAMRPARLPAAYLCTDRVCLPPVYDAAALSSLLAEGRT